MISQDQVTALAQAPTDVMSVATGLSPGRRLCSAQQAWARY
jgi:hypothetical protein